MFFFFFNDTATTEIYTLSLHDALPISATRRRCLCRPLGTSTEPSSSAPRARAWKDRTGWWSTFRWGPCRNVDRKSTRLNSSHLVISYAVFCLKKKITAHDGRLRGSHQR